MIDEIPIKEASGQFRILDMSADGPSVLGKPVSVSTDGHLAIVEKITRELNLNLKDEILERRFKNIILIALKEIRTELQTKEALTKSQAVGGLGLEQGAADKIIELLKKMASKKSLVKEKESLKKQPAVLSAKTGQPEKDKKIIRKFSQAELRHELAPPAPALPPSLPARQIRRTSPPASSLRPVNGSAVQFRPSVKPVGKPVDKKPGGLKSLIKKRNLPAIILKNAKPLLVLAKGKKAIFKKEQKDPERYLSRKVKPFISQPPKSARKKSLFSATFLQKVIPNLLSRLKFRSKESRPAAKETGQSLLKAEPRPTFRKKVGGDKPAVQIAFSTGRDKVTDIKIPTRLTGPIEELRNFKLAGFRQLNSNPQLAILKIKEKIDLLSEQSFNKRIEGISAWKKSEVHRLYLILGKESLERTRSLEEIIRERAAQKQPFLTSGEFTALGKLNKMLEY